MTGIFQKITVAACAGYSFSFVSQTFILTYAAVLLGDCGQNVLLAKLLVCVKLIDWKNSLALGEKTESNENKCILYKIGIIMNYNWNLVVNYIVIVEESLEFSVKWCALNKNCLEIISFWLSLTSLSFQYCHTHNKLWNSNFLLVQRLVFQLGFFRLYILYKNLRSV